MLPSNRKYWLLSEEEMNLKSAQLTLQLRSLTTRIPELTEKFDLACYENRMDDAVNWFNELYIERTRTDALRTELQKKTRILSDGLRWLDIKRNENGYYGQTDFCDACNFYNFRRRHGIVDDEYKRPIPAPIPPPVEPTTNVSTKSPLRKPNWFHRITSHFTTN